MLKDMVIEPEPSYSLYLPESTNFMVILFHFSAKVRKGEGQNSHTSTPWKVESRTA